MSFTNMTNDLHYFVLYLYNATTDNYVPLVTDLELNITNMMYLSNLSHISTRGTYIHHLFSKVSILYNSVHLSIVNFVSRICSRKNVKVKYGFEYPSCFVKSVSLFVLRNTDLNMNIYLRAITCTKLMTW